MSNQTQIDRLTTARNTIRTKMVALGLGASDDKLDELATQVNSIALKTSSNLTASGATVSVPAGYYASDASKSVATATQATPSISVSSAGLITASATQSAGYVASGTKSGTKQLTTQAAKTVTPSTSEQTAVASGVYTTGAVKVAAIPSDYKKLPSLTNPASAADIVNGYEAIDTNGNKITGAIEEITPDDGLLLSTSNGTGVANHGSSRLMAYGVTSEDLMIRAGTEIDISVPKSDFGNATAADVAAGKTFTSAAGLKVTGTATAGENPQFLISAAPGSAVTGTNGTDTVSGTTGSDGTLTLDMPSLGTWTFTATISGTIVTQTVDTTKYPLSIEKPCTVAVTGSQYYQATAYVYTLENGTEIRHDLGTSFAVKKGTSVFVMAYSGSMSYVTGTIKLNGYQVAVTEYGANPVTYELVVTGDTTIEYSIARYSNFAYADCANISMEGSEGGGGVPFATGSFTGGNRITSFTVSGLSFTPKLVCITNTTSYGTYSVIGIYSTSTNSIRRIIYTSSAAINVAVNNNPSSNPITYKNDGFTASSGSSSVYFSNGNNYDWIAIG